MAKEKVLIGCRLPSGMVLQHPKKANVSVTLRGVYAPTSSGLYVQPLPYVTTEVDAELWASWKEAYSEFPFYKSRAIFEASSESDAAAKGRELEKEKTGFEAMPQSLVVNGTKLERAQI